MKWMGLDLLLQNSSFLFFKNFKNLNKKGQLSISQFFLFFFKKEQEFVKEKNCEKEEVFLQGEKTKSKLLFSIFFSSRSEKAGLEPTNLFFKDTNLPNWRNNHSAIFPKERGFLLLFWLLFWLVFLLQVFATKNKKNRTWFYYILNISKKTTLLFYEEKTTYNSIGFDFYSIWIQSFFCSTKITLIFVYENTKRIPFVHNE